MFQKLVFQNFREEDFPAHEWERIRAACGQVVHVKPEGLTKALADADGLLVKLGSIVGPNEFSAGPKLKIVGMFGTGYGRIDTAAAKNAGVAVFNVADYATQSVAEFVFGVLLNHVRGLPLALERTASGDYTEGSFVASQLQGKTLGLLGLGAIGRRVATMASAGFGMNVLYWSRNRKVDQETASIRYAEPSEVLAGSDFVSLHFALTPETEGFMSASRIAELRPGAVLLNTAPMELLDLATVEQRLAKHDLTFILDHSDEMSLEELSRLGRFDDCIIYPPIAYVTKEAAARKQAIFVDNIVAGSKGGPLPNQVN